MRAVCRHGHVGCCGQLPHTPTPIAACGLQLPWRAVAPNRHSRHVTFSGRRASGAAPLTAHKPGRQATGRLAHVGDGGEDKLMSERVGDRLPAPFTVRSHRARRRVRPYWSAAVVFPFALLRVRLQAVRSGIPTGLRPAARRYPPRSTSARIVRPIAVVVRKGRRAPLIVLRPGDPCR